MARFRVYRLGNELAVDLQTNLLDSLHTRVMAPLVPARDVRSTVNRLNPRCEIDGTIYVMLTEFIAATDFLFQGL